MQKNKLGALPNTMFKNELKWIKNLNRVSKNIKLSQENIHQMSHYIRFDNDFLYMTPKTHATKKN